MGSVDRFHRGSGVGAGEGVDRPAHVGADLFRRSPDRQQIQNHQPHEHHHCHPEEREGPVAETGRGWAQDLNLRAKRTMAPPTTSKEAPHQK